MKKATTAAVERVSTIDEPLAHHLESAIGTGLYCSYEPPLGAAPVDWVLD